MKRQFLIMTAIISSSSHFIAPAYDNSLINIKLPQEN